MAPMTPWTLLLIGAARRAAGLALREAEVGGPGYRLIHSRGYPDSECNPNYIDAVHLGHFGTVDECALAAKKEGVQVFTYEPTGGHVESCIEMKIPSNTTVWSMWMDSAARGADPACPGGGWIPNQHTYVYAWMPPAPAPAPPALLVNVKKLRGFGSGVKAFGDPHLVNVKGQRFDIYRPGAHNLLQIPQGSGPSSVLLQVTADVKQIGGTCGDMYFVAINVTGHWALSGLQFLANAPQSRKKGTWRRYGPLGLKVAWGHTVDMFPYLNVYVKDLSRVGHPVGGLLGEDDHTYAATPGVHCKKSLSLLSSDKDPREEHGSLVSFATVM